MPIIVYIYIALQLLIVAYYDMQSRKIINLWPISNIALFTVFIFLFPKYYHFSISTLAWPLGFFLAGFILFILKIMGGGDSKYLASFYLLVPENLHEEAFMSLAIATLMVGGSVFIKNIMKSLIHHYKTLINFLNKI